MDVKTGLAKLGCVGVLYFSPVNENGAPPKRSADLAYDRMKFLGEWALQTARDSDIIDSARADEVPSRFPLFAQRPVRAKQYREYEDRKERIA